jgi:hypothetical protein
MKDQRKPFTQYRVTGETAHTDNKELCIVAKDYEDVAHVASTQFGMTRIHSIVEDRLVVWA